MGRRVSVTFVLSVAAVAMASAQPQLSDAVLALVKVDAPVVALTNVRVIDGAGAPARAGQTLIIRGGNIAEVGDAARVRRPEGATVLDLTGRSVIPGLVMVHEHLNGDLSAAIGDVRNVEVVFKQGIGFDRAKLIDSVRGKAGLW
jgi:cytosine/adenosine deaminase-related metal-dependent hydrolase